MGYVYFRIWEKWPLNGSPDYYTIIQLELFLLKVRKIRKKKPYVQAFVSLYHKDLAKQGNNLMTQRKELALKLIPDGKIQKEKVNK